MDFTRRFDRPSHANWDLCGASDDVRCTISTSATRRVSAAAPQRRCRTPEGASCALGAHGRAGANEASAADPGPSVRAAVFARCRTPPAQAPPDMPVTQACWNQALRASVPTTCIAAWIGPMGVRHRIPEPEHVARRPLAHELDLKLSPVAARDRRRAAAIRGRVWPSTASGRGAVKEARIRRLPPTIARASSPAPS